MDQKPESSRSNMQALLFAATLCFIAFQNGRALGALFARCFNFDIQFSIAGRLLCLQLSRMFSSCLQKAYTVYHTMLVSPLISYLSS